MLLRYSAIDDRAANACQKQVAVDGRYWPETAEESRERHPRGMSWQAMAVVDHMVFKTTAKEWRPGEAGNGQGQ